MKRPIQITTFYKFLSIAEDEIPALKNRLLQFAETQGVLGLVILGVEGFNSTLSGPVESMKKLRPFILETFNLHNDEIDFKDSYAEKIPFHEMKVKVRKEIVTLNRPGLTPSDKNYHLSPEDWHQMMQEEDTVIIDTRNDYEYEIGHFKNAINPDIKEFTQFPDYIDQAKIDKNKKMMIYCTGGIRCEKAILDLHEKGYKNVFQLDGGILNYLKHFPNQGYDGECFVFDYRVAVDQNLSPTKTYRLCPHCGDPGDLLINCRQCEREEVVCRHCHDKDEQYQTCSKNCAHHFRMGHKSTKQHLDSHKKKIFS